MFDIGKAAPLHSLQDSFWLCAFLVWMPLFSSLLQSLLISYFTMIYMTIPGMFIFIAINFELRL